MQNRLSIEIQTIVLLCLVLIFQACKTPTTIEGPELNELYGPFQIKKTLSVSTKTADFASNGKVSFSVELSKIGEWTITITGLNSKAQKIISGKSKILDETNAVWNGSTTIFPRFGIEKALIQVSFKDTTLILRDTVQIISTKIIETGFLVTQFPGSDLDVLFAKKLIDYSSDGDQIITSTSNNYTLSYRPVLGSSCLVMKGVDKNKDTYLGNVTYGYNVFATSTATSNSYPISNSDPNEVYFNMAVFGVATAPGSTILMQFFEDCNDDGKYIASADNMYEYRIKPNWEGWKIVSFKYNQATISNTGNVNKPQNPSKIVQIGFIHLGDLGMASEIALDYPCFTYGAPLEP